MAAIKPDVAVPMVGCGWYTNSRDRGVMLWWNGREWKDGHRVLPESDNGSIHALRFIGLAFVFYLAAFFLIGFLAIPFALRATGRRARDFLMLFIPIWGAVLLVQTLWRLSPRRMCWLPRTNLPSKPLFGPSILPVSITSPSFSAPEIRALSPRP